MIRSILGSLGWRKRGLAVLPLEALRLHLTILGTSGSGKTETINRIAYAARKVHRMQIIYLDAKGNTKREEEEGQDNAARFVAAMHDAGAVNVAVYPSLHYNGWLGTPTELKNRLLSVVDYTEPFYGDFAAYVLDLALNAPTTPRSSSHFLANLRRDRLLAIYKNHPIHSQQIRDLDKELYARCEMRYQVFFQTVEGTLDGTLDLATCDAAYLRVRGFALRDQAPRLGRFFIADIMQHLEARRKPGTLTLIVIDELNALRMREMTSILFEQCRDFGGCLVISSQGYAGLGPPEYANRILDACSTYILHRCSDPHEVCKRAGDYWTVDTSYSEDEEGNTREHSRPILAPRLPPHLVIQQIEGQAYWIYSGQEQQVQTVMLPLTEDQIRDAWRDIRRQEEIQRQLSEAEARRRDQRDKQGKTVSEDNGNRLSGQNGKRASEQSATLQPPKAKKQQAAPKEQETAKGQPADPGQPPQVTWQQVPPPPPLTLSAPPPAAPPPVLTQLAGPYPNPSLLPPVPPLPDPDDNEPDRL
jgi:hypothetical protein